MSDEYDIRLEVDKHARLVQHKQMQDAVINQFVAETARAIFANLVAALPEKKQCSDWWREAAARAQKAAPYLAEAYKLIPPIESAPQKQLCPHDMEPHECDACMRESDFQFDAAREGRMFGR